MIVLDASVWLESLRSSSVSLEDLEPALVPGHFEAEVLHGLRGLVRGGHMSREQGAFLLEALRRTPFSRVPVDQLVEAAWPIAEAVSGCDALYVALARRESVPLVTTDACLARGAADLCEIRLLEA